MKSNVKNIGLGILIVALLLSMLRTCAKSEQLDKLKADSFHQIDSIKNAYNQVITLKDVEITTSKDALKKATDSLFNLKASQDKKIKEVIAYYKGKTKIVIDSVDVPYIDTAATKIWEDSVKAACSKVIEYYEANTIAVPKTAKDSTKNYKADLTATLTGITINNLELIDLQTIRWVVYKGGLLKKDITGKRHLWLKKKIGVQIVHTNPHIKVIGAESAIYQAPNRPRILEKIIFTGIGIYLGTKL